MSGFRQVEAPIGVRALAHEPDDTHSHGGGKAPVQEERDQDGRDPEGQTGVGHGAVSFHGALADDDPFGLIAAVQPLFLEIDVIDGAFLFWVQSFGGVHQFLLEDRALQQVEQVRAQAKEHDAGGHQRFLVDVRRHTGEVGGGQEEAQDIDYAGGADGYG